MTHIPDNLDGLAQLYHEEGALLARVEQVLVLVAGDHVSAVLHVVAGPGVDTIMMITGQLAKQSWERQKNEVG